MRDYKRETLHALSFLLLIFLLSSCAAYLNQPTKVDRARIGELTPASSELLRLPKTTKPVVVAVYKFRDQTGQYKPSETGSNWSTAVTQGATTILMKALEDSKWFIPVERENVSNLLNERKILRSSKSQLDGNSNQPLPPLYYAGIILEGGIISYDTNIMTGGMGARYFGTGGSTQYRQDRISIYLRAVSTKTGEVLKTVYTSKTILSQSVDVGMFRYVSFKRLLEVETGFTYNEPIELAVTEAIEKAVYNLVMEGLIESYWLADSLDVAKDERIIDYLSEKSKMNETDLFGRQRKAYRSHSWVSVQGLATRLNGDLNNPLTKPGAELGFGGKMGKKIGWQMDFAYNHLGSEAYYDAEYIAAEFNFLYMVLPEDRLTPIFNLGLGVLMDYNTQETSYSPTFGLNMEYMITRKVGLNVGLQYHHMLNDKIDNVKNGKYNDYLLKGRFGCKFYFGNF